MQGRLAALAHHVADRVGETGVLDPVHDHVGHGMLALHVLAARLEVDVERQAVELVIELLRAALGLPGGGEARQGPDLTGPRRPDRASDRRRLGLGGQGAGGGRLAFGGRRLGGPR